MSDHKKMLWIRYFNEVASSEDVNLLNGYCEHEVASECWISGVLDYKDKGIIFVKFLTLNKDSEGLYHYLVRIKIPKKEFKINNNASKSGYAHTGLIDELIALMSVFFRCRFYKIATYCIFSDNNKIKTLYDRPFRSINKYLNKHIFDESFLREFGDFGDCLNLVESLNPSIHQSLIRSCYFYLTALKEIGIHRDISYIRLVSAIESLLEHLSIEKSNFEKSNFEKCCEKLNFNEEQKNWLKEILSLDNNGNILISGIQGKFISFIEKHSKYLCDKQNQVPLIYVTVANFSEILKRIYRARSSYLHAGKPMYLSLETNCNEQDWHFDSSCRSVIDNCERTGEEKLPYEWWFEKVVNDSIMNFIRDNN